MVLRMSSPTKNSNGVYYARLGVPAALRSIIGKRELKRSLKTRDPNEAKDNYNSVMSDLRAQLSIARTKLESESKLTDSIIDCIIFEWRKQVAIKLGSAPHAANPYLIQGDGIIEENNYPVMMLLDDLENLKSDKSIKEDNPRLVKKYEQLESLLKELFETSLVKYQIDPSLDGTQYRKLLTKFAVAYLEMTQAALFKKASDIQLANHGFHADAVQKSQEIVEDGTTMKELWRSYSDAVKLREPDKAKVRLMDYGTAINRFIAMYSNKPIATIKRRDIAEFRRILEKLPARAKAEIKLLSLDDQIKRAEKDNLPRISQSNIKKQLNAVSAVFTFAIAEGLIETNPVHGVSSDIKKAIPNPDVNKGYTTAEIKQIFQSRLFATDYKPQKANYGKATRWLPLILAYTGARVEEIAQMYVADIDLNGEIPMLKITNEREDQSVKSGKVRYVPIHSHLLELGLARYISSLPSDGLLFPELKQNTAGKYHGNVSKWFGKYLQSELKIQRDGLRHYHGFRHSFITACRENGVQEAVQDEITGHSHKSMGRQYGTISNAIKKESIEKIPRWF